MKKRIIMIHGRGAKPASTEHINLWKASLVKGAGRAANSYRRKLESRTEIIDVVYYGDVNNRILFDKSDKHKKRLENIDAAFNNAPCLDSSSITAALRDLNSITRYTKKAYEGVIEDQPFVGIRDEIAGVLSTIGGWPTLGIANRVAVAAAFADLGAYFSDTATTNNVRDRLFGSVKGALEAGEDIMVISHSMGCIVAYDVLWQITRLAQNSDLKSSRGKISKWITIGCPLGEIGVRNNLIDGSTPSDSDDKYPDLPETQWINIAAKDDFIAHKSKMRRNSRFRMMERRNQIKSITDKKVYNCYSENGKANPHKAFGYITHADLGHIVGEWLD